MTDFFFFFKGLKNFFKNCEAWLNANEGEGESRKKGGSKKGCGCLLDCKRKRRRENRYSGLKSCGSVTESKEESRKRGSKNTHKNQTADVCWAVSEGRGEKNGESGVKSCGSVAETKCRRRRKQDDRGPKRLRMSA